MTLWDVTHRHEPAARRGGRAARRGPAAVSRDRGGVARRDGLLRYQRRRCHTRPRRHRRATGWTARWPRCATGVSAALVNVGGDLYALGTAPDGDGWQVGIQDPADDRKTLASVSVADAAIAASGTYQQFFRWRSQRFHHLMDPRTGAPRDRDAEPDGSRGQLHACRRRGDRAVRHDFDRRRADHSAAGPGRAVIGTA